MAAACAVVLAGCGEGPATPAAGEASLTARAVAVVMLDHLPDETVNRTAVYVDEQSPEGLVGANLSYAGEDNGSVTVTVSRSKAPACRETCASVGQETWLHWDLEAPEEDPGIVSVLRQHGDELVTATTSGPVITDDPRDLDLSPSVDELVALVNDPRLSLSTTEEVVAAGERLESWGGGEVPAGQLEEVPNNDRTVVMGWISAYGPVEYVGPAPVKELLGEDGIAGRVKVAGELGPLTSGFIDAFASSEIPGWMMEDPCLPGYRCVDLGSDPKSNADDGYDGVRLIWRAAQGDDPGDAYVTTTHGATNTGIIGFHTVGNRLPADADGAAAASGAYMWGLDLIRPTELTISMTTSRQKFDAAMR